MALALTSPVLGHAGCKIESVEMPVKMAGSRAVATVGINGSAVPLTVDTGAFFSVLTEAAAEQLRLRVNRTSGPQIEGITGRMEAATTRVEKLELLKGELPRVEFVVGGNEPGAGTMGLMGRNLLSFTDTEYDLAHGAIRFAFPNGDCVESNMAYWAGAAPVNEIELLREPRNPRTPAIRARVELNGQEFVALLDTGASTFVTARAARRAGVADSEWTPIGPIFGAGRGSARAWTAAFETFRIGSETIRRNRLLVGDFDMPEADMLLGIDFVLAHRIYVSKKQSRMYLTYGGGPVFALDERASAGRARATAAGGAASGAGAGVVATADQFARRGAASAARGDFEAALDDLNRACELDSASAAFVTQRGTIFTSLRRRDAALADFDRALVLDPAEFDARARRAALRLEAQDRDGALADLDALDQTLAPQAQMRLAMSKLYFRLDRPDRALAQLNRWLPAHPLEAGREAALNDRCWARVRLGIELDAALGDCDDAVDSDPKNPNFLDSRGWLHLRLGRERRALTDFDRSLGIRSGEASTLYGRGLTRIRLGDAAGGETDLAAARKSQPDIDIAVRRAGLPTEAGSAR